MAKRKKNPELLLMGANPHRKTPRRNPSELLLMGANPLPREKKSAPYDKLSVADRLAFGRLGLGKAQLQTAADIRRARAKVREVNRFRNALPNSGAAALPGVESPNAEHSQNLFEEFHAHPTDGYVVTEEPHIPAGNYAELAGELVELVVKPTSSGELQQVQVISFEEGNHIKTICDARGKQLYFAGDGQELRETEIRLFTSSGATQVELGECRNLVYKAAKWHFAVPDSARGKHVEWDHRFGEDGGYPPKLFYNRATKRLLLEGGTYHVERAGIVN